MLQVSWFTSYLYHIISDTYDTYDTGASFLLLPSTGIKVGINTPQVTLLQVK